MALLKTFAKISSITLLSRILGFVRDALIARLFGANPATDAFFMAFRLPNLLRRLFSEGAFAQAFVPLFSSHRQQNDMARTRELIAGLSGMLGIGLAIMTAIGMLAAPLLVWLLAPGFTREPATFWLTVDLMHITLPYVLLISLSSLASSILNAWERFSIGAITPILLSLSLILFSLCLTHHFNPPIATLAWATLVGGCLQLLYPLIVLKRMGLLPRPRLRWRDSAVWHLLLRMGPAIFAVSVGQIALLCNSVFASFLVPGSISWLYYADRLMEFPTGVLGAALGTILLPTLSRHAVLHDQAAYNRLLDWGLRLTLLLALPATIGLAMLSEILTWTLFRYGHFSTHDAAMTQQALLAYAPGLTGLILVKVVAPGFFARQNIRGPLRVALLSLLLMLLLDLLLIGPLQHAGLALAVGLASLFNALLLIRLLHRSGLYQPEAGWPRYLLRLTLALACMALMLHWAQGWPAADWADAAGRSGQLLLLITVGMGSYFAALLAQGMRLRDFLHQTH